MKYIHTYVCMSGQTVTQRDVTNIKDETIAPINGFYRMCCILLHILIQKKTNLMQIINYVAR